MELSRRDFLKASGAGMGILVLLGKLGLGTGQTVYAGKAPVLPKKIGEKTTICPYDASGCGFIVEAQNGKVINIEGDPDHPINRGAACSKGASLRQLSASNPWRLSKVLYRAPGGTDWEERTWDWALDTLSQRIKKTRDASFTEKDSQGRVVNRTEALGCLGGAALDNEECYLLSKLARSLGLVYLEHHARL
jgi:formate dehydrogenase major subunit